MWSRQRNGRSHQGYEVTLQERIAQLVAKHGSLRAVARATEIDVGYLSRLCSGEKASPKSDTLRRLGLRRVVSFEPLDTPKPAPTVQADAKDAGDTLLDLLADIDKHMRAEWDAGRLPASCWPTEFTQRIDAAHAQQKGGAK